MANVKDLKKRIRSTKNTYKITTAMKLVSAAKLNKAQQRIQNYRPYAQELDQTVRTAKALAHDYTHSFFQDRPENKQSLALVISADKGLCGPYNNSVVKEVRQKLKAKTDEDFKVSFIGKKAKEVLGKEVNQGKHFLFDGKEPSFEEIQQVGQEISDLFVSGEFGRVYVVYNYFKSAIQFETKFEQILPLSLPKEEEESLVEQYPFDFKYDEDRKNLLDHLLPKVFISDLYSFVCDAVASEHGARMSAMESASKNCKEVIKDLTLTMNKIRQAAITTELTEVVSGAESLDKG